VPPSELASARLVAVYGYGREGRSFVRYVQEVSDADVLVLLDGAADDATRAAAAEHGFDLAVGHEAVAQVLATLPVDVVLRSPGVSIHHGPLAEARARGVAVTTSLNLWFAAHRPDNVIAVTATKGKSTTTSLIAHLLTAAGQDVITAGNIGVPVLDLTRTPEQCDHVVLELSSYQLADLDGRVAVGAWLNLHREHLDWHGDEATYAADKGRIVDVAAVLVANAADPAVAGRVAGHPDLRWYDVRPDPVQLGDVTLAVGDLRAALAPSRLVGEHQVSNLAAALTVAATVGVPPADVLDAVADFTPLRHRLELVHDDGRRWVDDSIATIPEAAVAALAAFPDVPVTLLAGGFDRGQDHAPLVAALAARPDVTVVTLPDTGARLAADLVAGAPEVPVTQAADLAEAVAVADRATPAGGVVLLSPAAPSYGRFVSFEERGDVFAELVRGRS
jgi:UDP-N-acetylmuramoyl-L-alanine---L-glutamate ligase